LYKSRIPVIEQATETAASMLSSDKSRGYCLEMICADFLAVANLDYQNPKNSPVFDDESLEVPDTPAAATFVQPIQPKAS
jgi:hypothetical protein